MVLCAFQGSVLSLWTSARVGPGPGDFDLGLQWPGRTAMMSGVRGVRAETELQVTDSNDPRLGGVTTGDGESWGCDLA